MVYFPPLNNNTAVPSNNPIRTTFGSQDLFSKTIESIRTGVEKANKNLDKAYNESNTGVDVLTGPNLHNYHAFQALQIDYDISELDNLKNRIIAQKKFFTVTNLNSPPTVES